MKHLIFVFFLLFSLNTFAGQTVENQIFTQSKNEKLGLFEKIIAKKLNKQIQKVKEVFKPDQTQIILEDVLILIGALLVILGLLGFLFNPSNWFGNLIVIVVGILAYLVGIKGGGSFSNWFNL